MHVTLPTHDEVQALCVGCCIAARFIVFSIAMMLKSSSILTGLLFNKAKPKCCSLILKVPLINKYVFFMKRNPPNPLSLTFFQCMLIVPSAASSLDSDQ